MESVHAMPQLINPIPLPLHELIPGASLFVHASRLHGRAHIARTLIHAFLLTEMNGQQDQSAPLWAAIYMHDLARTHDGKCHAHGANAVRQFGADSGLRALWMRGGVRMEHYPEIFTAVTHHARPQELPEQHPHRRLTALLKDADGLDRVRINDLNINYLRFPESRRLASFAQWLYDNTPEDHETPDFFERIWNRASDALTGLIPSV